MTAFLPQNLLALFAPRDPIPFLPPLDKLPHEKKLVPYAGVSRCLEQFENPKDTPPPTRVETKDERKERKRKERAEQVAYKLEQDLALWDPAADPNATSDPFRTLFVARINYDTSESKLRREFEVYGPVKKIHLCTNRRSSKPRGYAFIEYEHERDMHSAYKHADGKKIDGRRVLVDVERARTVKGWRPRRLGGGLGGTRKGGPDVNTKYSGRDDNANRRESRSRSRERDEGRRERHRSRSRSKGRRERPERPERAEREQRRHRSRSRERRKRSRSRERKRSRGRDEEDSSTSRSRRRRSRSRERRRSRSRDRKRSRRSRSRDRKHSRSRDQDDNGGDYGDVRIKEEPKDDGYPEYEATAMKAEPDVEENGNGSEKEYKESEGEEEDTKPPPPQPDDNDSFGEYGSGQ